MAVIEHAKATVRSLEDQLASILHDMTIAIGDVSTQVIDLDFDEYRSLIKRLFLEFDSYLTASDLVGTSYVEAPPAKD